MKINPGVLVPPSATVQINTLALQKKQSGERVYNLSAGEPMLPPSLYIIAAAEQAIESGKTLYPPVAGIPELRTAVTNWVNATYQTQFTPDESLVTCGGKHGLLMLLQTLIEYGDEVLIVAPYWVSYPSMVKLYGGAPRIILTEERAGWKVTADAIEQAITLKTKLLILNNAANPTGVIYSREELRQILAVAINHHLTVLSDEVYSGLVYDKGEFVSAGSFAEWKDSVCVIQSASKHFAMTGWRVGFVLAPVALVEVLTTLQSQSTTGTSSISQWAALGAIEHAAEIIPTVRQEMQARRDIFIKTIEQHFGSGLDLPTAGLYSFISLAYFGVHGIDSVEFCRQALAEGNIALVPGVAFGAERYVRFSFGADANELTAAVAALHEWIKKRPVAS